MGNLPLKTPTTHPQKKTDRTRLLTTKLQGASLILVVYLIFLTLGVLANSGFFTDDPDVILISQTLFFELSWLLLFGFSLELMRLRSWWSWIWYQKLTIILITSGIFAFPVYKWELNYWGIAGLDRFSLITGWLALVLCSFIFLALIGKKKEQSWIDQFLLSFLILVATIGCKGFNQFALGFRQHYGFCFLWLVGVAVTTDSFAFWVGFKFGRRLLAPKISPQKTIEGLVGGILAGLLTGILFSFGLIWFYPGHWLFSPQIIPQLWLQYLISFGLTLLLVVGAVVGDLLFSWGKRRYQKKDFSYLIRGHGGLLDRCDSLLFASVLLLIVTFIPLSNLNLY